MHEGVAWVDEHHVGDVVEHLGCLDARVPAADHDDAGESRALDHDLTPYERCRDVGTSVCDGDDDLSVGLASGDGGQAFGRLLEGQPGGDVDPQGAGGSLLGQRCDDLADRAGHDVGPGEAEAGEGLVVCGAHAAGDLSALAHGVERQRRPACS